MPHGQNLGVSVVLRSLEKPMQHLNNYISEVSHGMFINQLPFH